MDVATILASVVSAGAVGLGAGKWIAGRAVDHALARKLEEFKASLAREGAAIQAQLEASLRRADEIFLGEQAAERSYRFEARKRLYGAVGPLRFQLIGAAVQYLERMESLARYRYATSMQGYFGQSTLYRLARLLALTELVERQVALFDFSADPDMVVLLRFRAQLLRALSSSDVTLDRPDADWTRQKEHIYRDHLPVLGISMIVDAPNGAERALRFDEFREWASKDGFLWPLREMIETLHPTETPILWLRLIAIAQACTALIAAEDIATALDPPDFSLDGLLSASEDAHIRANGEAVRAMLDSFSKQVALPAARPPAPGR